MGRPDLTIILSAHARDMLEGRGIAPEWVIDTIKAPDRVRVQPDKVYSFKAIRGSGGKILKVVHRKADNDTLVITAHFDRNAKP